MPSTITSMGKGSMKISFKCQRKICPHINSRGNPTWGTSFSVKQTNMKVTTTTRSAPIVLRYFPRSRQKDDQSPFSECLVPKSTIKIDGKHGGVDWAILIKKMVYFHYTKHAIVRWLQHLSLALLLLSKAYSKKKVAYRSCTQVMGLTRMHTSY